MAQQGSPPRRSSGQADSRDRGAERPGLDRLRRTERQEAANWRQLEEAFRPESDSDLPPWAGPGEFPRRAATAPRRPARSRLADPYGDDVSAGDYQQGGGEYRGRRRGADADAEPLQPVAAEPAVGGGRAGAPLRGLARRRGRAAAARLRKSRRRVVRWCGIAIVACVIAAGVVALVTHHPAVKTPYVTSLQNGEFKAVPDACASVTATTLGQYLPGPGLTKSDELSGATESECSFTVDNKPNFLVLEVTSQQYQPFAAATGDGSASANAQDNFVLAQQGLAHPVKHSPLSAAVISPLAKVGQSAIIAYQTEHVSKIATDLVTVVVRQLNVVITVSLSGQESGHGFGPVPLGTLEAGATAAAKDVLAKLGAEPKA